MEFSLLLITMIDTSIYACIVLTLLFGFLRLTPCHQRQQPPVSVIVAARNEEANIDGCLQALTKQNYPDHLVEVIIVDDRSTDTTAEIVKYYTNKRDRIKLVQITDPAGCHSAKKRALAQGIASASNDILLFTDADCRPPCTWVSSIVQCFAKHTGLVVGFSPLTSSSLRMWDSVLGMDSLAAGFVAAGAIGIGSASMCTGRNWAYRRQVFDDVGGFAEIARSVSGDDDLFLQLVKRRTHWRVAYAISPESIVPANGPANVKEFIRQKKRHLSAGRYYGSKQQIGYGIWHLSNFIIWILAIFAFFVQPGLLLFLAIKLLIDVIALGAFARQFHFTNYSSFFLWEFFFAVYHLLLGPISFFGKVRWKG